MTVPSLFGIANSNRDFSKKESWGKNIFNSSFPASLACWLGHKKLQLKYLMLFDGKINHSFIDTVDFLGLPYNNPNLYFSFEADYNPYQKFVIGNLPRIDLVTMDNNMVDENAV
jgi:hypothetical protein